MTQRKVKKVEASKKKVRGYISSVYTGAKIEKLRTSVGLTRQDFASILRVKPITIWRWETEGKRPRQYNVEALQRFEQRYSGIIKAKDAILEVIGQLTPRRVRKKAVKRRK